MCEGDGVGDDYLNRPLAPETHLQLLYSVDERVVGPGHLHTSFIQGLQVGMSLPGQHRLQCLKELNDLLAVLPQQTLTVRLLLLQLLPELTHLTEDEGNMHYMIIFS